MADESKTAGGGKRTGRGGRRSPMAGAVRGGPSVWTIAAIVAVVLFAAGVAVYVVGHRPAQGPPAGVQAFSGLARDHVDGHVDYPQIPPVGGAHSKVWLNCGIYPGAVANENAVHSMEHGAVWITYQPTLSDSDIATLRDAVRGKPYTLLSPYPNLPAPVVASGWGVQLRLPSASDPRLTQFIHFYQQGPQTPEPGAPCSGGTGSPAQ